MQNKNNEYFISKEFDAKLSKAFDMYYKAEMDKLDEKMKKENVNITFSKEFGEKIKRLIEKEKQ